MTKQDIIDQVKSLNLPPGSYIVFGGAPMTMAGIRESQDVDMLANDEVAAILKQRGWKELNKGPDDKPLVRGVFEVHSNWNFSAYRPTLEQLLQTADYFDGIAFASLEEVKKWKAASKKPKHQADIKLIDAYLAGKNG